MYELHQDGKRIGTTCSHMTTARARALVAARESGRKVQISRNGIVSLTVSPDGEFGRPLHSRPVSEVEDCTKGTGRVCFCSPCRAERRARG